MTIMTITGIGGQQQAAIAAAAQAGGWQVRGTRRAAGPGIVAADLETGAGLADAFAGAHVVVFTLPQNHRPGAMEVMAASVTHNAAAAGVGRIVLNLAGRADPESPLGFHATLRQVRQTVLAGPVPAVVLEPTIYMDNLLAPWAKPAVLGGTLAYPTPPDLRVAWMSHHALAQAVVAAATADVAGQSLLIGGPEALSGEDLSAVLAAHLGRAVAFAQIPLDGFAAGLNQAFGPPAGDRIAELYQNLAAHPDAMSDGAQGMARLGVVPETFAAFVARSDWR